jgi:hypothetical protein
MIEHGKTRRKKMSSDFKIKVILNPDPRKRGTVRIREASLSVVQLPGGQLKVWGCTFTLPGEIGLDGRNPSNIRLDEKHRKQIEKELAKFLESLEFPEVGL